MSLQYVSISCVYMSETYIYMLETEMSITCQKHLSITCQKYCMSRQKYIYLSLSESPVYHVSMLQANMSISLLESTISIRIPFPPSYMILEAYEATIIY